MAVPKYDELMKPMLTLLADGNLHTMKELQGKLAETYRLTDKDLAELLPSGRQSIFANRVGWAKTYLKKAGLLTSPKRAACVITADGLAVLKENPSEIDAKYLNRFEKFLHFQGIDAEPNSGEEDRVSEKLTEEKPDLTPDDRMENAYKEINDGLAEEVLEEVMKVPPIRFEKMVLDLLLKMGYGSLERNYTTKASGDGGIDGVIMQDKLGFSLIYMQAKHWEINQTVSKPTVQSFVGAIAKKDGKGLFVTTAKFSEGAKEYAADQHIILIDGNRLAHLMIEHNFCVAVKNKFEIKKIDTDAFLEYQEE